MKVCGIIAEFNPLHNGHARLLAKARQITEADYLIVVMSGDYVQRGEPALLDKYTRATHALLAGADLVLELPLPAATGSARYFARGAVSTLAHTGVVDTLLFGSESGDLEKIRDAGSKELNFTTGDHTGRTTAAETHLPPNDLLAAEYLRAMFDLKIHAITPFTIPRSGAGYHDNEPSGKTASASYLRERLLSSKPETIEENQAFAYVPLLVSSSLQDYRRTARFLSLSDLSEQIACILLRERAQGYTKYFDVYDDLSDKIRRNLEHYTDVDAFLNLLKSKDIAYSHLSRALLHILLSIRKDDVELFCRKYNYCPWLRPLAFRKTAYLLLHAIRENGDRRLLSKLADAEKLLDQDGLRLLRTDLSASELYAHLARKNGGIPSEYRRSPIILS